MKENEILKKVADLTIGRKIKDVIVPTWKTSKKRRLRDLINFRQAKAKPYKIFELYESVAGNTFRIASVAVGLPNEILGNTLYEMAVPLIQKHHKDLVYILAAGISNSKAEPSQELIDLIEWNLSYKDLYENVHAVLDGAGMQAFLNTTILIKGSDAILRPRIDPMGGSELIASHSA